MNGPSPRLILSYLNGQAIANLEPTVEVNVVAFANSVGLGASQQNIRTIRDSFDRLVGTEFKLDGAP